MTPESGRIGRRGPAWRALIHSVIPVVTLPGLKCGVADERPKGPSKESDHGRVCRIGRFEGRDQLLREERGWRDFGARQGAERSGSVVRGAAGALSVPGADCAGDRDAVGLAGARAGQAGAAGGGDRRAPGARGDEVAAQQDGRGRRGASGRARAHRVLPCGGGEERSGAGGAGSAQGAGAPGAPAARYGERDPRASGVVGHSLSQGDGQAGRPGPRRLGGSPRVEGDDRAAVVQRSRR